MQVFISWSGDRSRSLSVGLHDWLQMIIQRVEPWMSDRDIEVGQRWTTELAAKIKQANFAILCLTPENAKAPWLHFEAGALAEVIGSARVVPLLLDMEKSALAFPLAQFQAVEADHEGVFQLVRSINRSLPGTQLGADVLSNAFNMGWPSLARTIDRCKALNVPNGAQPPPSDRSLLEEVLKSVRGIENQISAGSQAESSSPADPFRGSWEEHYVRGVNRANSRGGTGSDLAAINSFSVAISCFPTYLHKNTLARLYTYRGAMFKRLGRLDEARSDLVLATKWAQQEREINDLTYNLACIAAMSGEHSEAMKLLSTLKSRDKDYKKWIRSGIRYFESLQSNPEFKALIG
ncbi:MAG: toll/interleukin-1 receptor domain-containing protein [Hyphomicrobiaceae bacterium]